MVWTVIKRRLGKAGGEKERLARQREWNRQYGEGHWDIGYVIEGEFVSQTLALESVYQKSYEIFFDEHSDLLNELLACAKVLRNPHALATSGVDLQVPAIMKILNERGLTLNGNEVVDVGSWQGKCSHAISTRLSPLHIKCSAHTKMNLEKWWQKKKCLAIWSEYD